MAQVAFNGEAPRYGNIVGPVELGRRLSTARTAAGFMQAAVARRALKKMFPEESWAASIVSRDESGDRHVPNERLAMYASLYGVSAVELLDSNSNRWGPEVPVTRVSANGHRPRLIIHEGGYGIADGPRNTKGTKRHLASAPAPK